MKVNELMQGYIVLYEYDGQKFPARVIEIYRNSVLVESIDGEYEPIEIEEDKIFPVSLTPEILEKNGWKNSAPYVWQKEYRGFFFYWEEGTGRFGMDDFRELQEQWEMHLRIMHTHQLQNALRLCGVSKEIEL